jgi:HSP20 family protein
MSNLWPSLWSPGKNELDPFHSIGREIYGLFNRMNRQWPSLPTGFDFSSSIPTLNVAETKDAIEILAELPGLEQKDVNVTIEGNRLTISGERKQDKDFDEKDWHVTETSYGSFKRTVLLPFEPTDAATEASFEKGMLRLKIDKPPEATVAKRTIEIKPAVTPA